MLIANYLDEIRAALAAVGVELRDDAYLFSNDPAHARPWNPDWVTHQIAAAADAAGVELDIKGGRHYTASQLLAGGFDLRNTAARLGHSGGGATTLRHYADPVPEVDRRAAAYLAKLTAGSAAEAAGTADSYQEDGAKWGLNLNLSRLRICNRVTPLISSSSLAAAWNSRRTRAMSWFSSSHGSSVAPGPKWGRKPWVRLIVLTTARQASYVFIFSATKKTRDDAA